VSHGLIQEAKSNCPLCKCPNSHLVLKGPLFSLAKCEICGLYYKYKEFWLSESLEKDRYLRHQNSAEDPNYIKYFEPIVDLIMNNHDSSEVGLDFGCGNSQTLANILGHKGLRCESYDLYFFNKPALLEESYNFVVASEVIEHLRSPAEFWQQLSDLMKNSGKTYIRTKCAPDRDLEKWWYLRDSTHICFYTPETFNWISERMNLTWVFASDRDITIWQKNT
jgi:hypothetical protein